jgi:hypothetical protein
MLICSNFDLPFEISECFLEIPFLKKSHDFTMSKKISDLYQFFGLSISKARHVKFVSNEIILSTY